MSEMEAREESSPPTEEKMSARLAGYMTKNPTTVRAGDDIKDAIDKMKKRRFSPFTRGR